MDFDDWLRKQNRQAALRQEGISHERVGLGAFNAEMEAFLLSLPVLPDTNPQTFDATTGAQNYDMTFTPATAAGQSAGS